MGGSSTPEASVCSVDSVGEPYAAKPSVGICEICGRTSEGSVGMAGCHTLLRCAVGGVETQRGHGGMPCPLMSLFCGCTVWLMHHLLGWCTECLVGALETSAPPGEHPLKDYLTSTFLTLPSAVRTMFRPFWSLLSLTPLTVKNSTSPSATVVALMPVSGSLGAVQSLSTTLT